MLGALGLAGVRNGALHRPLAIAALAAAGVNALTPLVLAVPRAALVIPAGGSLASRSWGSPGSVSPEALKVAEPSHHWVRQQRSQGCGQDLDLLTEGDKVDLPVLQLTSRSFGCQVL